MRDYALIGQTPAFFVNARQLDGIVRLRPANLHDLAAHAAIIIRRLVLLQTSFKETNPNCLAVSAGATE